MLCASFNEFQGLRYIHLDGEIFKLILLLLYFCF